MRCLEASAICQGCLSCGQLTWYREQKSVIQTIIPSIQNWRFWSEFRDSCNQQNFSLLFRRLLDCHCLKSMLSLLIDSSTVIVFTVHFAWVLVTLIFPQCQWCSSGLMYMFIVLLNGKSHCSYDFCHLCES